MRVCTEIEEGDGGLDVPVAVGQPPLAGHQRTRPHRALHPRMLLRSVRGERREAMKDMSNFEGQDAVNEMCSEHTDGILVPNFDMVAAAMTVAPSAQQRVGRYH